MAQQNYRINYIRHQTKIGPHLSDTATLISGVIQGSGVGPLMFLVYINELATVLEKYGIKIKLFADDVKLYVQILNDIHCGAAAASYRCFSQLGY